MPGLTFFGLSQKYPQFLDYNDLEDLPESCIIIETTIAHLSKMAANITSPIVNNRAFTDIPEKLFDFVIVCVIHKPTATVLGNPFIRCSIDRVDDFEDHFTKHNIVFHFFRDLNNGWKVFQTEPKSTKYRKSG